ncbi:cobalamin B12-binding domain-containing protein [Nocardioides marmoraquaticus]
MPARHTPLPELAGLPVPELVGAVTRRLGVVNPLLREVVTLHLETLVAAAEWNVPEVLTEQFRWERTRLAGAGVTLRYRELHDAVLGELDAHLDRVSHARLRVLYSRAESADRETPVPTTPDALGPGARAYLDAALAGDTAAAVGVVRTALARGASAPVVIREVLQPAQVETGRLWQDGLLSVAEEHRVTGITARCLGLFDGLAPPRVETGERRPRMLASTVGEEGHDLGLRMLAEVMTAGGWDVEYLGAGVPADDLVTHVGRTRPDVLALSATLAAHVPLVAAVVDGVRAGSSAGPKVLVGGRAFTSRPDLAGALGADGWACDADAALEQCRVWVGLDPAPVDVPVSLDGLGELARRYRIDAHHVSGALDLLATHSGISREELQQRLDGHASRPGT